MKPITRHNSIKAFFQQLDFSWRSIQDYLLILLGSFIQALGLRIFLVPANLVSGGISGAAQLIHFLSSGWPIGLMVLIGNIPLFILGWRFLGGPKFALRTILAIISFSVFTDILGFVLSNQGVTTDLVLNTLYGGLVLGIGLGIVYRGRGTSGGTDILGRILNRKFGITISLSYLITDSLVVLLAGFVFGWERALYGLVMIYVSGVAADVVTQGTSIIRTALIVTNQADRVTDAIMVELDRGVTIMPAIGGYTGESRSMLYCAVTNSEVMRLKTVVHVVDEKAFMVIGHASEALGEGFKPLHEG
ncbi:MAG: YitT family protein [Anaerolineaceae bacterium]|nr:YitT family protein [Anaerolineaceae bacterium]